MRFEPRPYQQEAIDAGVQHMTSGKGNAFMTLPTGCHAPGTPILMHDMTVKPVESVAVDDMVMGPDGTPRRVLKLHSGEEAMYRIIPNRGGDPFVVNEGHVLALESTVEGKFPSSRMGGERDYITVGEYLRKAKSWRHLRKLFRSGPIKMNHRQDLLIDPWFLGVILGDGCTLNGQVSVCTPDNEIISEMKPLALIHGCTTRISEKRNNKAVGIHFVKSESKRNNYVANPLMTLLKEIGVAGKRSNEKFIPDAYKRGSIHQRSEILAGLLDTDGHHDGKGGYDYISHSETLANDVAFVARSLGITAHVRSCVKACQTGASDTYFRVSLSGNTSTIPCRVKRKVPAVRRMNKNPLRTGFKVELIGPGQFYGFTLDGDHLYLTADFTVHHNSGKSIVVAGIADRLDGPVLVFQPSKEILMQNYHKMRSFGHLPAIFSASAGKKQVAHITFAMIGSVINNMEAFRGFKHIIVDECHLVAGKRDKKSVSEDDMGDGKPMYIRFLDYMERVNGVRPKLLGLTATPYRLGANRFGAQVKFLNRMAPRVFDKMIYNVQIGVLQKMGFLSQMEYFRHKGIDVSQLQLNSSGSEYTDASIRAAFQASEMEAKIVNMVERLMAHGRKSILVFTKFVEEASNVAMLIPGAQMVSGETPKAERDRILEGFKAGVIPVITNCSVLTTGFDHPELDTVVLARPTKSLSLYYQMVGRAIRPHKNKVSGYVIDMVGLVDQFGYVENFYIENDVKGLPIVTGMIPVPGSKPIRFRKKQLTNTIFVRQESRSYSFH